MQYLNIFNDYYHFLLKLIQKKFCKKNNSKVIEREYHSCIINKC